nr:MAG: hypothetical protein [Bacteriophage sp.]
MTKKERNEIIKWAEQLTDEELEKEYYEAAFESLGTLTDEMYERGYDEADIREREELEQSYRDKSDILEMLCLGRGIKLWE